VTIVTVSVTVLIVDDHAGFRRSARALLEVEGFARSWKNVADRGVALSPAVAARLAEAALPLAPGRLTDRERKVLDLVATGLTTAEIALRLRVSSAAVRRHLSSAVRQIVASRGGSPLDQQKERKP
jgi:DNA-binding CsgD family transcriptional regulator